jgi:hypothetical protein
MNVTQDFVKGGIKDLYGYSMERMEYAKTKEDWLDIWDEVTVEGDYWQETSVIGPKKLRKTGQNEGFTLSGASEGYTVYGSIFDYTDAIAMSYDAVRDVKKVKNILRSCAEGWGEGAIVTRLDFYANWFNKGGYTAGYWAFNGTPESGRVTDTSNVGCYDSASSSAIVALFARTGDTYKHTSKVGASSYYNALASGVLTNTSIVNLVNLVEVTNAYDEQDVQIPIDVDTILYPKGQWETINRILESDQVAGGTLNDKQVIGRKLKYRYEVAQFSDTDAIFVGVKKKGFKMLKRMDPVYDFFENKMARAYVATVEMRMGGMFQNFRFWGTDNLAQS